MYIPDVENTTTPEGMNVNTSEVRPLSTEEIVAEVEALTLENVSRTYRGRPGCGCGCRGRYAYPSLEAALEDNDGSIPEYRADGISRVKAANDLRDLKARASEVDATICADGTRIYALEDDKRYVWVYTRTNAAWAVKA